MLLHIDSHQKCFHCLKPTSTPSYFAITYCILLIFATNSNKFFGSSEVVDGSSTSDIFQDTIEDGEQVPLIEESSEFVTVSTHSGKVRGFRTPISHFSIYFNEQSEPSTIIAVDSFLGIPYAKPPIGELRFRSPIPAEPWVLFNATKPPNACPQLKDIAFGRDFKGTDQWNAQTPISEDCLTINIWVPYPRSSKAEAPNRRPLAVMVWIYGGSYANGATSLPLYDGKILASRYEVIVVSINYRTGSFGFLYLGPGSEVNGNAGLFDQLMAMKWIKRNIGRFGGDSERITLVGESAGASSISYHLLSPLSASLFHNAILQSSAATNPWGLTKRSEALKRAKLLALAVQCQIPEIDDVGNGNSSSTSPPFYYRYHDYRVQESLDELTHLPKHQIREILACLRSQSIWSILAEESSTTIKAMDFPFAPVVDGELLKAHPKHLLDMGLFKRTNILLGTNANEGPAFLVYYLDKLFQPLRENVTISREEVAWALDRIYYSFNKIARKAVLFRYTGWLSATTPTLPNLNSQDDDEARKNLWAIDRMSSDYWFTCSVSEFADYYAQIGERVYMYQLSHRSSQNPWPLWMGVMHGDEIAYMFGDPLKRGSNYTLPEKLLSASIMRYWTNFVKYANPNINGEYEWTIIHWPIYTYFGKESLELNVNMSRYNYNITRGPRSSECAFQKAYLPQLQKETEIIISQTACQSQKATSGTTSWQTKIPTYIISSLLCLAAHLTSWLVGFYQSYGPGNKIAN